MPDLKPVFALDDQFARTLPELAQAWRPTSARAPELVVLNHELAAELGLDVERLRSAAGVELLAGAAAPEGANPVAQGYSGHQFGSFSPRLGDGRAVLLGELTGPDGRLVDLHLKGSGRTAFARGGDGLATLGPMLREHLIGEAMHALDVPTTRGLAVTVTGEQVRREEVLPGAVLARVASSHLRVGSFQYAAQFADRAVLRRLADHAIDRHHPEARQADNPHLALFERVVDAQAHLVARWMSVGFIHGVMNTDNTTISGQTIDYGPCAFLDAYDEATVFSSIDHAGRYAYGNQPRIVVWNLARLAEALLPLFDEEVETAIALATEVLDTFEDRHRTAWLELQRAKPGLATVQPGDDALIDDLHAVLRAARLDLTQAHRSLSKVATAGPDDAPDLLGGDPAAVAWIARYRERLALEAMGPAAVAASMDRANPVYIPRNHKVEEALEAAVGGDLGPYLLLVDLVTHPFEDRPGLESYASPPEPTTVPYRTYCGT